jgi:REP element-mobilizing transposase RayT
MARPLRIEFPGAIYHVTSRGDRREAIFDNDADRETLLKVLAQTVDRFDAGVLAYCLMDNHYHFVIQTRKANLSRLMRQLNGVYTQLYNRKHGKVGHLFQGRFKAILVDQDAYLLEVCRYVDLNPVRARLIRDPAKWHWSSYRAHVGQVAPPEWLDSAAVHGRLLGRAARTAADRRKAAVNYAAFVAAGKGVRLWEDALQRQMFLGDAEFVDRMQARMDPSHVKARDIPKSQRVRAARPIQYYLNKHKHRDDGVFAASREGQYSMTAIAVEAELSIATVSRIVKRMETAEKRNAK